MENYFEIMAYNRCTRNNNLSIKLPKIKTECARNGFYYQGAYLLYTIYYHYLPKAYQK